MNDKLTPTFSPNRFTVIDKKGSNVTIQSNEDGRVFNRNVAHLKRIASDTEIAENDGADETPDDKTDEDVTLRDDIPEVQARTRRKPTWIKDYVI